MSADAAPRTRIDTRPGRTSLVLGLSLVVAVLAGGLAYRGVHAIRTSKEGKAAAGANVSVQQLPLTPAYLIMAMDHSRRPVSFAVLAPAATGGGTIVILPATARVQLKTSTQPERLSDAFARGGAAEQTSAVARYLGVEFAGSYAADEALLSTIFKPYAPVDISLVGPVLDTDDNKSDRVLHAAGPVTLSAEAMAQLMLARADGESEDVRLPRLDALWTAVAKHATAAAPVAASPGSLPALLDGVLRGPNAIYRFAATKVSDTARNPAGLDLLDIDIVDIRIKMAQMLPGAVSSADSNVRVEIRDPFHNPALVRDTVTLLTFLGAHVVFIHETADLPLPTTAVQYQNVNNRAPADFLANNMQKGAAQLAASPIENIDVTIILGTDLRDESAARIATSTTAAATVGSTTKP
jgi:hypothetical protein